MSAININTDAMLEFLVELLNIPSPTGYHVEAMAYIERKFQELGMLELCHTYKGALVGKAKGESDRYPVGLTAHTDTLGLMVRAIKPDGRLKVSRLGGILMPGVENEGVTIRTFDNKRIRGTVIPTNNSTHVNNDIHRSERSDKTMEVRLDEVTESRADTEALGIGVGDFIFIDPRVEVTETGFIKSRFLDDKAGVAVIYAALLALKASGATLPQDTYIHIANYEEVGHGGSSGMPTTLAEMLCVDMGAIGEDQSSDEYSLCICAKDAGGPYHFDMTNKLRTIANQHDIPYNVDIYINYASDGTAYWKSGSDARVGLAGPGIASSHSYERTHVDSLNHTAQFLARYMLEKVEG